MLLALHHYVRGDAAEFFQKNPISNCYNTMCWRLAALFLKHYQIMDNDLPMMGVAEDWVATAGYDYLRLLYSDDFDKLKPIAVKLKEQTGINRPLLPVVRRKQRWELIIDQLMKMNVPKGSTPRQTIAEMERVAYMVNMYNYAVQPHAFEHTCKPACSTVSARHGYAARSHANQGVDTHESRDSHGHQVLQGNNNHQQGEHDDQWPATLLDDLQVALETNAGKECQHKNILQCTGERHLNVEPPIQRQGHQREDDATAYWRKHAELLEKSDLARQSHADEEG